jgi:protein TonB
LSAGQGEGEGIGNKKGSGVGSGTGSGVGPGQGAGTNNGKAGTLDGKGTAIASLYFNLPKPAGYVPFSWIYRPTPVVTPEAQANKSSGTVVVMATFRADGTITDIEIKNQVDYMTESAIDALKRARFRPASINGVPITLFRVPVRIDIELTRHR